MIIVRSIVACVEELLDLARLPSVEELRPTSCPGCGRLAFTPGEPLGIVGHGTYRRQVLGIDEGAGEAVTCVRRYFCRGCECTIQVLADHLHPRRWYAGGVILEALRLHLVEGVSEREIRERFGVVTDSPSWRSLRRWRSELLFALWYWLARRLGVRGEARTRTEGRRRLGRLLGEAGSGEEIASAEAARVLVGSTVHFRGKVWLLGRDPPGGTPAAAPG